MLRQDSELQKWIQDIFEHGFLSQSSTKAVVLSYGIIDFMFLLLGWTFILQMASVHFSLSCYFDEFAGIPQSFSAVAELVRFVTMVMFTCSGQNSVVNSGQVPHSKL